MRIGLHLVWSKYSNALRDLVAEKFAGSKQRRPPGRPRTRPEIEGLVVRFGSRKLRLGL